MPKNKMEKSSAEKLYEERLFDRLPIGLIILSPDTLWLNRAAQSLLQTNGVATLKFENFLQCFAKTSRPEIEQWATKQRSDSYHDTIRVRTREENPEEAKIFALSGSARDGTEIWILRDISTAVKAFEDADEARARALNSARMAELGEVAGGIAHEVNNPLTIIEGQSYKLRKLLSEPNFDTEGAKKCLDKIESTVGRISKIIKTLRNISRKSSTDPMEAHSLQKICEDALELTQERLKQKGMKFEMSGDLNVETMCRPSEIAQVLLNLINNSMDAIESLAERWIKVNVVHSGAQLEIRVIDSGPGIAPSVQSRLMQPFFTTKPVGQGTGLGLSISRTIILNHGGTLDYETLDNHTSFVIRLPRVLNPGKAA